MWKKEEKYKVVWSRFLHLFDLIACASHPALTHIINYCVLHLCSRFPRNPTQQSLTVYFFPAAQQSNLELTAKHIAQSLPVPLFPRNPTQQLLTVSVDTPTLQSDLLAHTRSLTLCVVHSSSYYPANRESEPCGPITAAP